MDDVIFKRMFDKYAKEKDPQILLDVYNLLEKEIPPADIIDNLEWIASMTKHRRQLTKLIFQEYDSLKESFSISAVYKKIGKSPKDIEEVCKVSSDKYLTSNEYKNILEELDKIKLDEVEQGNPVLKIACSYANIARNLCSAFLEKEAELAKSKEMYDEELEEAEKKYNELERTLRKCL